MREYVADIPAEWLESGPIEIFHSASILATFMPGTAKVVRFVGPHTFYRAAGWSSGKGQWASAYGSWWADSFALVEIGKRIDKFEDWLPSELLQRAWPAQFRGAAALCEDWNDMREMFRLELPSEHELIGLVGLATPQPQVSAMDAREAKTPMLVGGGEQVYFKQTPTLNSVNPLWVYAAHLW